MKILVIDGYGVQIFVERGHLVVNDGFSSEGKRRELRFPRGRSDVERIVVRAPEGSVTLSAINWCSQMGIGLAFVGPDSMLLNCLTPPASPDGPLKRAQGLAALVEDGTKIAQELLGKKIASQIRTIEEDFPRLGVVHLDDPRATRAIRELHTCIEGIPSEKDLRGLLVREAYAARTYWELLAGTTLPWPEWTKKRIPSHWQRIWPREYGLKARVREATDPFNAILNYGYTLLEVETRIACHGEGLDPDLGLIHVDDRLRESLIYDLMEPLRSTVDTSSLQLCAKDGLRPHMFHELRDGVVRLDPDFTRPYAEWLMPKLRAPVSRIAAEFARDVRRIVVPYRLVDDRKAEKAAGARKGPGGPCGYCGNPLPKVGLKYCSRHCYLRHSVEIRQPIKAAQAKLAEMRAQGLSPGHGGEAARKRGEKIGKSNKRRSLGLSLAESRSRRAAQARKRRADDTANRR